MNEPYQNLTYKERMARHPCRLRNCYQASNVLNGIYCRRLGKNVTYVTAPPCENETKTTNH